MILLKTSPETFSFTSYPSLLLYFHRVILLLIWSTVYVLSVPKIHSTQIQETNIYYVLFQPQCTKQSWHVCRTMYVSNKSNKTKKGRINLILF